MAPAKKKTSTKSAKKRVESAQPIRQEKERKPRDDQNFWNFWLLMLSAVILVGEVWILDDLGKLPTTITFFDVALITLATFRITRLFVYDTIMQFVRDWFQKRYVAYLPGNKIKIVREKYQDGVSRAMSDLLSCPWCTGLQAAIFVVFFYYLSPYSWIVILMFAVGGVATFFQLMANAVGWRAENLKRETQSKYPPETLHGSSGGTCG